MLGFFGFVSLVFLKHALNELFSYSAFIFLRLLQELQVC